MANDGTVFSWGYDAQGQLGNNTVLNSAPVGVTTPVHVLNIAGTDTLKGVSMLASWRLHNLALIPDVAVVDLTIAKSHSGNFWRGPLNAILVAVTLPG